jgi:hypothetical protein
MFLLNGKPLSPDVAFTTGGIQYPANFLRLSTLEEKEAIGITEVPDPPTWDQRFYWGYTEDGELIPKDHTQLVEQWVAQTRITAGTLIQPTDWMVIREQDNGTVVPESVKALREDIRLATGQKNAAIEPPPTPPNWRRILPAPNTPFGLVIPLLLLSLLLLMGWSLLSMAALQEEQPSNGRPQ